MGCQMVIQYYAKTSIGVKYWIEWNNIGRSGFGISVLAELASSGHWRFLL